MGWFGTSPAPPSWRNQTRESGHLMELVSGGVVPPPTSSVRHYSSGRTLPPCDSVPGDRRPSPGRPVFASCIRQAYRRLESAPRAGTAVWILGDGAGRVLRSGNATQHLNGFAAVGGEAHKISTGMVRNEREPSPRQGHRDGGYGYASSRVGAPNA